MQKKNGTKKMRKEYESKLDQIFKMKEMVERVECSSLKHMHSLKCIFKLVIKRDNEVLSYIIFFI